MRWLVPLFLFVTPAFADKPPIIDENLRMAALRAIFPGMRIESVPGNTVKLPPAKKPGIYELDSPDALAKEKVYRVAGEATTQWERCASEEDMLARGGKFSNSRLLRFQLYRWPASTGLLAVLQYRFEGAQPSGACWSVGLVARLEDVENGWKTEDRYVLDPQHHTTLMGIRLLDLVGDPLGAELVVESDFGGAGTWGSNLLIFRLKHLKLEQVLCITSRISYEIDDMFKQSLDVPKTILRKGQSFCFTKTTMFENRKPFAPPRVTISCYDRGEGVDQKESMEVNEMWLKPLP